ncbi:MAG: lysozyme inhibitor LprI family protein [Granulosicoccus sp.]
MEIFEPDCDEVGQVGVGVVVRRGTIQQRAIRTGQMLDLLEIFSACLRGSVTCVLIAGAMLAAPVVAVERYDVLQECTKLSTELHDIHTCLDNYLDDMDDRIEDIRDTIEHSLEGESLAAFRTSQAAFSAYRRENCLWYLEFSTPVSDAEQIAKSCLATMSQQRLSELQRLIATGRESSPTLKGFFVYGATRNTFQPCGSNSRYWVEGESVAVSKLQQDYLNVATADLQVLYVELKGELDDGAQATSDHAGVVKLTEVTMLRVPGDSDCRIPTELLPARTQSPPGSAPKIASTVPDSSSVDENATVGEPQQQLVAYFGAWQANCTETDGSYKCQLSTEAKAADKVEGSGANNEQPTLQLTRRSKSRTVVSLRFPNREIDSPERIRWGVDGYVFGDILGSSIRVDEAATRQIINERKFIQEELLPLLIKGTKLKIVVAESVDDANGDQFSATLLGLTRALAFADDFVRDGGDI